MDEKNDVENENDFETKIQNFLRRNFPQIQMHGGNSSVLYADAETGVVEIELSGACSGCGISPMTVQAIKNRMKNEIEMVKEIDVSTGGTNMDINVDMTSESDEDEPEAPF